MSLHYFTSVSPRQPYIRSYSILEEPSRVFNKRIILPDSYPAVVINFGAPFIWERENGAQVELPRIFFVRAQTGPLKIRATGWCRAMGLNLAAWATRFLVDEQVDLTSMPIFPLGSAWHDLAHLLEATLHQRGETEAITTLAQFISDRHDRSIHTAVTPVRAALEMLYMTNGQTSVSQLADHCNLSASQLERRSRYFTGLPPKMLARLIRFDATCTGLLDESAPRLTDLAQKLGYVDQAHFIHEFKSFADCTPREARAYIRQLAADVEFLQFS